MIAMSTEEMIDEIERQGAEIERLHTAMREWRDATGDCAAHRDCSCTKCYAIRHIVAQKQNAPPTPTVNSLLKILESIDCQVDEKGVWYDPDGNRIALEADRLNKKLTQADAKVLAGDWDKVIQREKCES